MAKKAFVTGSSTGIGKGIALELARKGYDVAVHCARTVEKAEAVAAEIRAMGREAFVVKADVRKMDELNAAFDTVFEKFGYIDLFVSNAGITAYRPYLEVDEEFFDNLVNNDFKSYYFGCQRAAKNMIANGIKGNIIMTTSVQAVINLPEANVYGTLKAGLEKLIRHMAMELAPYGIRVNGVAPGTIKVNDNPVTDRENQFKSRTPIPRLGCPADIAPMVCFLASEEASFISGVNILIDGAQHVPCLCDNTFVQRVPPVFK